ncbi:MAG: outer membrane beta-barrel protein [Bauldia sp.]
MRCTIAERDGGTSWIYTYIYCTVGLAATELTVSNAYSDNFNDSNRATGGIEQASHAEFRAALVLGAGAEWAVASHWTLRAEYLHTDFGSLSATGISSLPPDVAVSNAIAGTATLHADIVRLGAAYRF